MHPLIAAVDGREKGAIPVSIGTSLAVEAACGVYPDRPVSPAPLTEVKEVWFNLRTLLRNLVGALPTDIKDQVTPLQLLPALTEELGILESAVVKGSNGMCRPIFYIADYTSLKREFPKANLKAPTTPKQLLAQSIENNTLRALIEEGTSVDLRTYRFAITGQHPASFIVTHLPVDLLARYQFQKLELLESHTGMIKPYPQWHTKLTGGKDLVNIPFHRFSLQLFGDNGHQFSPMLINLRREVLKLADQDRWTSVSTTEKIRMSLRKIADPSDRALLLALL